MSDVQELLNKARSLGVALAGHPRVRAHYEAQRAVRADPEAQKLLQDYQAQLNHIRRLEAARKPIEVADKRKLRDLEARMAGHEALKTLMRTQADQVEIMAQVNRAIEEPLTALAQPEKPA